MCPVFLSSFTGLFPFTDSAPHPLHPVPPIVDVYWDRGPGGPLLVFPDSGLPDPTHRLPHLSPVVTDGPSTSFPVCLLFLYWVLGGETDDETGTSTGSSNTLLGGRVT